jgi:hypothetical protein
MRGVSIIILLLAVPFVAGAEPRLTKELGDKVRAGIGKMTVEEVLKAIPGPVKFERASDGDADWILRWDEATIIEVTLIDSKVVSASGEFNDTVVSKNLTFDNLKQIKNGMKQADVEKILGGANQTSSVGDDMGQTRTKCRLSQGRRVFANTKEGKVSGGGYMEGQLP